MHITNFSKVLMAPAAALMSTVATLGCKITAQSTLKVLLIVILVSIASWTGRLFCKTRPPILTSLDNWQLETVQTQKQNVGTSIPGFLSPTVIAKEAPIVCAEEACKSACLHNTGPRMPAIIHMLWKNASIPGRYVSSIKSWHRRHPDWTFVLWRDIDLEPMVRRYFPTMLNKFKTTPQYIMRIDLFRYMLMFQYGGVYADLDHDAGASLEELRRQFPAVVTREPEVNALSLFGFSWPIRALASPAIMMSAPGHRFYRFFLHELNERPTGNSVLGFAGPLALTNAIEKYKRNFGRAHTCQEFVYLAPSYSFNPYPGNRLKQMMEISGGYLRSRMNELIGACKNAKNREIVQKSPNLTAFCSDPDSMEPITSSAHTVYAVHDNSKVISSWNMNNVKTLFIGAQHVRTLVPTIVYGDEFMRNTVTKENVDKEY